MTNLHKDHDLKLLWIGCRCIKNLSPIANFLSFKIQPCSQFEFGCIVLVLSVANTFFSLLLKSKILHIDLHMTYLQ